jgi:hypothetical protein
MVFKYDFTVYTINMVHVNTEIHCRGNEDDIKEMWLSITREEAGARGLAIDFELILPSLESRLDIWGCPSNAIHEEYVNAGRNYASFDTLEAEPLPVYRALILKFPHINFFISCACYDEYDRAGFIQGSGGFVDLESNREFSRSDEEDMFAWAARARAEWARGQRTFARRISNKALRFVPERQSHGLLFKAKLFRNGYLLKNIKDKRESVCRIAVSGNPFAVKFAPDTGGAGGLEFLAVEGNPMALALVKNQTEALCLAAIGKDAGALGLVRRQTTEICLAALRSAASGDTNRTLEIFRLVWDKGEEICLAAVSQDGNALM